jgi:UDP-glucuronate decarboxylase
MSTILVAGGAGFIGANLCRKLIINGDKVVCVDNLLTSSARTIEDMVAEPDFTFLNTDICKPVEIEGPIKEVYDLACPASPPDYQRYPLETLMVCADGVKNMLDLANIKDAKFLHTSTSEIYGDPLEHPQKETYWGRVNPIGERSCYDEGKRFAESLIVNYRQQHNLDAKIVRIFNTYGPRMRADDGRVVSNFINQALCGEDLTIYGDGSQTRSFCYVDDMIEGLMAMMASDETGPINLGNPIELTVRDLADKVLSMTSSSSLVTILPLPADDPLQRRPDISLAQEKLGWNPNVSLDDGLRATIKWFQKQQDVR